MKLFVYIQIINVSLVPPVVTSVCDAGHEPVPAGNIGQAPHFPWLGVLKVHIHERSSFSVGASVVVLIKAGHALVHADDVSRLAHTTLIGHSRALFIPSSSGVWECGVKGFVTHPEYQYSTVQTVALLELDDTTPLPMKPVCWPRYALNVSTELYVATYVDENKALEKYLTKVDYVEKQLCEEFYSRAEISGGLDTPTHYQCAASHGSGSTQHCEWENGAALITNNTGRWTLIGIGILGPGCSAPARFIDVVSALPWVQSATDAVQDSDEAIPLTDTQDDTYMAYP